MHPEKRTDTQYEEHRVERVETWNDGWYGVTFDKCMGIGIPPETPVKPEVGMTIRLYGKGFGYPVRGIDLNGFEVYYRTQDQQEEHHRREAAAAEQERREDFEKNRASLDTRYDALPDFFRRRIDKFRTNNADFRWKFERYELFCCEQAVSIARTMLVRASGTHPPGDMRHEDVAKRAAELVTTFHAATWDEQKAMVPELSDGHSGNTFGCACRLAQLYLTNPEGVVQMHGAMAPLVGSEEYGCVPRGTQV